MLRISIARSILFFQRSGLELAATGVVEEAVEDVGLAGAGGGLVGTGVVVETEVDD